MKRTVLLTGATGYLGRHLMPRLLSDGCQVYILKRPRSDVSSLETAHSTLRIFDIETDGVSAPFAQPDKVDTVIHLATCYGKSGESASDILNANFTIPAGLLEAAIKHGTDDFINADTYFNVLPLGGTCLDNYALSKGLFHAWAGKRAEQSGLRLINLRLEHLYGPNDSSAKFVNWLVHTLLQTPATLELTSGAQVRDFIYIDDVVEAFSAIIAHLPTLPQQALEIDVGSGEATSIRDFVEMAARQCHATTSLLFGALPMRQHEIMHAVADPGTLRSLGWQARTSLSDGLRKVIQHARQHSSQSTP